MTLDEQHVSFIYLLRAHHSTVRKIIHNPKQLRQLSVFPGLEVGLDCAMLR